MSLTYCVACITCTLLAISTDPDILFTLQDNFTKVGSFLRCIFSRSLWNTMERKIVRFSSEADVNVPVRQLVSAKANNSYLTSDDNETDNAIRDFIAPTICSLCSNSIAAVSYSVDVHHGQLLLTMMRLYANTTLVKSVYSSLHSNHPQLLREHRGEKVLRKKLLVIVRMLFKAARLESGVVDHPQFTEDVLESSLILLLKCDLIDVASASSLLCQLVKVRKFCACTLW